MKLLLVMGESLPLILELIVRGLFLMGMELFSTLFLLIVAITVMR